MSQSTIDYRYELTSSTEPQPWALLSPMSKTVRGLRERETLGCTGFARTEDRTAGLVPLRVIPVPVIEGPLVFTRVINGDLDGEG